MNITIIGAGPGGLITGLKLLEAGFEPKIIEKQEALESTLCGEGISAETLGMIPFRDWSEFAPQTFGHATFFLPGGYRCYAKKKCFTMDRTPWLRAMSKEFVKRGGSLEMGRKVESVNGIGGLVVGADGPFSVAAKFVGNHVQRMAGVQYRMKSDYEWDGMEFYLDKTYSQEYSWIFAKGGLFNVGLLGYQKDLEQFIKDKNLGGEILKKEAYNIPFFGTRVQKENVVLTGDAAGITNPLTKGGMAAIVHAADILTACIKEGKIGEYQYRLFAHPVMAPAYRDGLKYFRELTNEELEKMGKFLDRKVLNQLSRWEKLRIMFSSVVSPKKMRFLMKASSFANKYSW
ncbi:MAG: NAD(P)/FAD-dependent oxidoreductase [Candidatus Aenigmarchaeota archaeon]|nr:NAD(P)/FAD-dependent oxidoreductase [Candidatus Aenigmarchaeota archaeon]